MQRYYSPSTRGFFADEIHGPGEDRDGSIPEDAIPIDDERWLHLLEATSTGKMIAIENGQPVAVEPETPEGQG